VYVVTNVDCLGLFLASGYLLSCPQNVLSRVASTVWIRVFDLYFDTFDSCFNI
jgi:hypothetical protein